MKSFYKKKLASITISLLLFVIATHGQTRERRLNNASTSFTEIMDRMMLKMDSSKSSVNVEMDFISQMVPHHASAVEMAKFELNYGTDYKMIQLAKGILIEQGSEIEQMQLWLKYPFLTGAVITEDYQQGMIAAINAMMDDMPENEELKNIDKQFATVMIPHHQAAIDMAKLILKYSANFQITAFAKHLISAEQLEIDQMISF